MDVGFFNIFFDARFDITLLSAVLAFATIVTLGVPFLERSALGNPFHNGAKNCAASISRR
jgi:hypothetical protein